ncbi:MAG: sensor histidine kinase [Parvibaculaceae bacterium]
MNPLTNSQEHIRRKVLLYWISMEDRLYLFRCSFPLALALMTLAANGLSSAIGWFFSAIALDTGTMIWRRNIKKNIMAVDIERCWQDAGFFHVAAVATYTIAGFNWVLSSPVNYVVTAIVFGASLMTHCSWVPTMRVWSNAVALLLPFTLIIFAANQADLLNPTSALVCLMLLGTAAVIMHFNRQKYFDTFSQLQAEQDLAAKADEAVNIAVQEKARAEESNRVTSDFMATMSHEIRTPMNAIMGFSDLITRISKEPKTREYSGYIQDASVGLLTVLNDVLTFSKMEADKVELDMAPLELSGLFESLLFWSAKARDKNVDLKMLLDDLPHEAMFADEGRLRQILSNLISNALKFTPEGGRIVVRARVVSRQYSGVRLRFEVSDTGIGFAENVADKLFAPFVQANGDISKTYGGTGLGLAICSRLVRLMGGDIGANGKPDEGATFWFEVTLDYAAVSLHQSA